jgi:hypothetical protein
MTNTQTNNHYIINAESQYEVEEDRIKKLQRLLKANKNMKLVVKRKDGMTSLFEKTAFGYKKTLCSHNGAAIAYKKYNNDGKKRFNTGKYGISERTNIANYYISSLACTELPASKVKQIFTKLHKLGIDDNTIKSLIQTNRKNETRELSRSKSSIGVSCPTLLSEIAISAELY